MSLSIRKLFPTLKANRNVYLDNASTSLKLSNVIRAENFFYKKFPLNPHSFSDNYLHHEMEEVIRETRALTAKWINCCPEEIAFTPSTTYSLNILALSFSKLLKRNDIVLLTRFEHSSNVYPWMAICEEKGAIIEYLKLNDNFTINEKNVIEKIGKNVKVVSFAQTSNNVGVINNIKLLAKIIKKLNPNCFIIIDACQSISHEKIDVKDWEIDALVFSAHKLYGPTGIGILYVRKDSEKKIPDLLWGGGKESSPLDDQQKRATKATSYNKFEAGTLPLAQIFGLREVFLFLIEVGDISKLRDKENKLRKYAVKCLSEVPNITIYNKNISRSIILFNLSNFHSHDVSNYLARNNIFVRAGNFCSPFIKELIGVNSSVRVSFAIYNNKRDVDFLVEHLKKIKIESLIF